MRRDDQWLSDIILAGEAIARFIDGLDFSAFQESDKDQSAVITKLIIIGEAAGKVSPELKSMYPDVEWRSITGLRHVSVHEYFKVEWDRVWETAKSDVPLLVQQVHGILSRLKSD